jgi:O-antigen/teichoic acid export membrane protein
LFKKIIKNTVIYSFAPYVASFANLLVLPIITKDLTEVDYGISGTITAYTGALSALSVLGLSVILNNSYFHYKYHYKIIWRQIYGFLIIWNVIYSILLGIFLFVFIPDTAAENRFKIIVLNVLPIVLYGPANLLGTYFYMLKQNALPIAIRTAAFGILAICLNLLFISHFKLGYMGWFYTNFIVVILTNFSYWHVLNKQQEITPIFNFKRRTILKSLRISLPLLPHQYSYYLLSGSERLIMDQVKISTSKIGEFNIASMFSNYVANFANAGSSAISPVLLDFYSKRKYKQARNLLFLYQAGLLIVSFLVCLWLKEAFYLLINNNTLRETYDMGIILIMALSFTPLFVGYYSLLTYNEKTKTIWRITFIAGLICIILNLIFLPIFGIFSASIVIFIAFLYRGLAGYYLKSFRLMNNEKYYPAGWVFLISVITLFVYVIKDINITIKFILTIVLILAMIPMYFKRFKIKEKFFD